jgi:hypothetical protein
MRKHLVIVVLSIGLFLNSSFGQPCGYVLEGDVTKDCKVDFLDLAAVAFNWLVDCTENPGHPSCVGLPLSYGDLVISEAMVNPAVVSDTVGEWFEVYNTKPYSIDMDGLEITDFGTSHTIAGPLIIVPYGRLVLGVNDNSGLNGGVVVDYEYSGFNLANNGDIIAIVSDGNVIDEIVYDSVAWPLVSGASMSLEPSAHDAISNDSASNWCVAQAVYGDGDLGTPGLKNDECPPPEIMAGDLVISEVMANPAVVSDTVGEWFEVYNTESYSFDMNGLEILDGALNTHTIAGPLIIGAYGRLVLGINGDPGANGGVTVDYVYSNFNLANTTDSIILASDGNIIDQVFYDSGTWPVVSGAAISLEPTAHDAVSNDNPSNWCTAQSPYGDGDLGTPGSENDECPLPEVMAGDLIISEVMVNPAMVSDTVGEWFEVYNTQSYSFDMNGLEILDSGVNAHTIDGSLIIGPYERFVFGINGDSGVNGGVTVDYVYSNFNLANTTDSIILASDGNIIDQVFYDSVSWPLVSGASMSLKPTKQSAVANDNLSNWCTAQSVYGDGDFGTPGSANDECPLPEVMAGDLIVSEVMVNPAMVSDTVGEWFEVYNTTLYSFDMNGVEILDSGTNAHTIAGSLIIGPYERLVFGINGNTGINGGVTVDYVYSNFNLANTTDSIIIRSGGNVIDQIFYDSSGWPLASGMAMNLDPSAHTAAANDSPSNWCTAQSAYGDGDLGTPGSANDTCP